MSFFSQLRKDDNLLWFFLGAAGVWAFVHAGRILRQFREVTVVNTEEKIQDVIGQHTEDAISANTLEELYKSPNYHIKQASLTILTERAIRGRNLELLLRNARSSDPKIRERAFTILAHLAQSSHQLQIIVPSIYKTVVDALVAFLPQAAQRIHDPHTDWKSRSKTERDALTVLLAILDAMPTSEIKKWLEAGLVTQWLGRYPFGGRQATSLSDSAYAEFKNKLGDQFRLGETDDLSIEGILRELLCDPLAIEQLRAANLLGTFQSREECSNEGFVLTMNSPPPLMRIPGEGETDADAAARRRRRREAVVIGDPGQPLGEGNIFNATDAADVEYEGFARVD